VGRAALSRGGLAAVLVLLGLYVLLGGEIDLGGNDSSPTTTPEAPGAGEISQQEAEEIGRVLALVEAGGPFPHDQDGTTFSNREGLLPDQPEGYYKEYTCETPGSDDRGARRLVIGEGGETHYTRDHYDSFTRIDPEAYR
jgi:ribonuclease T1